MQLFESRLGDESGAATVEVAISMLVLIPTLLYGLLIQDILMGRLDLQEAVSAAAWDFSTHYERDPDNEVGRYNRLTWCNHTSALDTFDEGRDCGTVRPSLGAHRAESMNVRCQKDESAGRPMDIVAMSFHNEYNQGGLFTCEVDNARFVNRIVPETFLQQWAQEDLAPDGSRIEHHDLEVDEDPSGTWGGLTLSAYTFAILADPWTLHESEEYAPGDTSGELWDRVNTIYKHPMFSEYHMAEAEFFSTALEDEIFIMLPELGQGIFLNMNIAKRHDVASKFNGHWVTPYEDKHQDPYRATHEERGPAYMGKEETPRR